MPQLILIIIALIIIYHIIVYVVAPALGIALVILLILAALGGISGIILSCYNFVCACRDNLFKRTAISYTGSIGTQEPARESFFYWKGDWWLNLIDTCKETWDANALRAKSFERQRERWWSESWGTFPAAFCLGGSISVWLGSIVFLPNIFVIFGSIFSLVFVTYNLLAYSLYGFETVYLKIHGVFTLCPTCGRHVALPVFICSSCKTEHHRLMPSSQYGIFSRICKCKNKLPTAGFTGRSRLEARCPHPDCGVSLSAEAYRPMTIAFIGGPSVGKSMVHLAICCDAERVFQQHYWGYSTNSDDEKIITKMKDHLKRGIKVDSTQNTGIVKALCIDLKKPECTFPRRLYFYDPPGELFSEADKMSDYNYYKYLRAAVVVVDPFSLPQISREFADELKNNASKENIKPSSVSPDESFAHWLVSMERDHGGLAKNALCAVLINKTDVPGFSKKAGLVTGASDGECRTFLENCQLDNFMRQLEENFRECRYFAISTTGGSPSGKPFQPKGIEQVMDWLFTHNCFE